MNTGHSGVRRLPRQCRRALVLAFSDGTPWRALKLAAVVGTLLVAINQWEALLGQAQPTLEVRATDAPLQFSVQPFAQAQLTEARHPHEMTPAKGWWLHLDHRMMGVGGDLSWRPSVHAPYLLTESQYTFEWLLSPGSRVLR